MKARRTKSSLGIVSILIVISAGVTGVLLIHAFGRSLGSRTAGAPEEAVVHEAEQPPRARAALPSGVAAERAEPSSSADAVEPELTRAEAVFDDLAKSLDASLLARLRADTVVGRRIARLALFPRIGPLLDRATAELLRASYVPELRAHPTETIREVRGLMAKIDSLAYAQERLSLYSVLTAVPDVRATMEELSHNDLINLVPPAQPDLRGAERLSVEQQQEALSWGPERVLPLMAYNYYSVATRNDPDLALGGTVDAIVAQADSSIRQGIAAGFVTAHPELKPALYAELSKRSVSVPDVQPIVTQPDAVPDPTQVPFKPTGPRPETGG